MKTLTIRDFRSRPREARLGLVGHKEASSDGAEGVHGKDFFRVHGGKLERNKMRRQILQRNVWFQDIMPKAWPASGAGGCSHPRNVRCQKYSHPEGMPADVGVAAIPSGSILFFLEEPGVSLRSTPAALMASPSPNQSRVDGFAITVSPARSYGRCPFAASPE